MKLLIASDIHGSAAWCERLVRCIENEAPDRVILLGDLLYHGPRNDLPEDYDPRRVAQLLNSLRPRPLCVRGNCEAEVDQMMLEFPVMADYASVLWNGSVIFLTHGHLLEQGIFPAADKDDVVLSGHTHVPVWERSAAGLYFNPGSVSIPKGGSVCSYMTCEDGLFRWKGIGGGAWAEFDWRL